MSKVVRSISNLNDILTLEEEKDLVSRMKTDPSARDRLVKSHMRLIAKMARSFSKYPVDYDDLISEGTIGLLKSLDKFDPSKEVRVSTYAMWWIQAALSEYVLGQHSMVRINNNGNRKSLFSRLRALKSKLMIYNLSTEDVAGIATTLGVSQKEVWDMDSYLQGDFELNCASSNATSGGEGTEGAIERIELLVDEGLTQEELLMEKEAKEELWSVINDALKDHSDRDRDIFISRVMTSPALKLNDLAVKYDISRERVRQIEINITTLITRSARRLANSSSFFRQNKELSLSVFNQALGSRFRKPQRRSSIEMGAEESSE